MHKHTHTYTHARTHTHTHMMRKASREHALASFVGFLLLYTKNSWIVTAEFQQQMYSPGAIGVLADTRDESGCASIIRLFSSGRSCTLQYEISGFQQKEQKTKTKKRTTMPTTTKAQAMSNEITQIHEFQEGEDGSGWGVGVVSLAHC